MRAEYDRFLNDQKTLLLVLCPEGSSPQEICIDLLERVGNVTLEGLWSDGS